MTKKKSVCLKIPSPRLSENIPVDIALNFEDHFSSEAEFQFSLIGCYEKVSECVIAFGSTYYSLPLQCTRNPYGEISIQWRRDFVVSTLCSVGHCYIPDLQLKGHTRQYRVDPYPHDAGVGRNV